MPKTVLCLSNGNKDLSQKMVALQGTGDYEVTEVTSVIEAEGCLADNRYDLLILGVMLIIRSSNELKRYPPSETDCGHVGGLIFYRHNIETLRQAKTTTIILTIGTDLRTKKRFRDAGLPEDHYLMAYEYQEPGHFITTLHDLLAV